MRVYNVFTHPSSSLISIEKETPFLIQNHYWSRKRKSMRYTNFSIDVRKLWAPRRRNMLAKRTRLLCNTWYVGKVMAQSMINGFPR
jgi:hypothetical protein